MRIRRLARRFFEAARRSGVRRALAQAVARLVDASPRRVRKRRDRAQRDMERRLADQERQLAQLSDSIRWLAEQGGGRACGAPGDAPLVSVVLPVWNAEPHLARAIDSVLRQSHERWELWIVDDGSTDRSLEVARPFCADPRVHLLEQRHRGASAARNRALARCRGEIVAYLDADNVWYPGHLAEVVAAFSEDEERDCVYLGQLVHVVPDDRYYLRGGPFDREEFERRGGIDLNAFAHRRRLFERLGCFDESLTRLVDWDLIARYVRDADPTPVPAISGVYEERRPGSISERESYWLNAYRIRRRLERPVGETLRVLYALWHYPQLSESYVRWEIVYMQRRGIHVEVWSELGATSSPFPAEATVHTGSLEEAIAKVQPHLVHVHWLHSAADYRDRVARTGLPLTVRGHGFEFTPERVASLCEDPVVRGVYVFPRLVGRFRGNPKVVGVNASFNADLFHPGDEKDRRLVVRTAAALPTKDLECFVRVAKACPEHRFVLVVGRINGPDEPYLDEFLAWHRRQGSPVDVRVSVQAEEVAALVRRAGIYLHTFGFQAPFGMPMSIAEALATGAWTIVRRCEAGREYVGDAGSTYDTAAEAAQLVRESADWPESRWQAVAAAAIERAYERHGDTFTLAPIVDHWRAIVRGRLAEPVPKALYEPGFQRAVDTLVKARADRRVHSDGSCLAHLIATCRILESWGCDREVCLAGLFHSVYGTSATDGALAPLAARAELAELLGSRAERLAYLNCAMDRTAFDRAVAGAAPPGIRDRFSGEDVALSEREFEELGLVHLADWAEQVPRTRRFDDRREAYRALANHLGGQCLETWERVVRDRP